MLEQIGTAKQALLKGFIQARKFGYIAKQNFTCCTSCARTEMKELAKDGYLFYTLQDAEQFRLTGKMSIAISAKTDSNIGMEEIAEIFQSVGFNASVDPVMDYINVNFKG